MKIKNIPLAFSLLLIIELFVNILLNAKKPIKAIPIREKSKVKIYILKNLL